MPLTRWRPSFGRALLPGLAVFLALGFAISGVFDAAARGSSAAEAATDGRAETATARTPVRIAADGRALVLYTRAITVGAALREAGVTIRPGDIVRLAGKPIATSDRLERAEYDGITSATMIGAEGASVLLTAMAEPQSLEVQRAVQVFFHTDAVVSTLVTTAPTVDDLMRKEGIRLNEGDVVVPSGDTPIQGGMHIYLRRARPVTLRADGQLVARKTFADTVAEFLESQGLTLGPLDIVRPSLKTPILDRLAIQVIRVREDTIVEAETLPFKVINRLTDSLELDVRRQVQTGATGLRRKQFRLRFEDGVQVSKDKEKEWVEYMPRDEINDFGTKVVVRQLATPDGTISYWRELRVFATWYDASDGGKSRSNPSYGYTRIGWKCEKGVVAVDPNYIAMLTRMYVPGYGFGTAADTGGGIKGMRIDLAFSEGEAHSWGAQWTQIYLLGPSPPRDQIVYILPQ